MPDSRQSTRHATAQAIASTSLRHLPTRLLWTGPSNHQRICQPADYPHRPGHNNVFLDSPIFRLHELQANLLYSYTRSIPSWCMSTHSQLVRLSILHSLRRALPRLQIQSRTISLESVSSTTYLVCSRYLSNSLSVPRMKIVPESSVFSYASSERVNA